MEKGRFTHLPSAGHTFSNLSGGMILWTAEGWLYLEVVLDLCSRMVVGWSMVTIQDAKLVVQALQWL